ncbi:hypothetical protein QYE76_046460 [Lolium multiflorum]|uniref:Uncharacterized protein n=1 Tax=Lolium multiflorum TaxID=4521 RepID=A0AAD8TPV9_LOLMU|nr:hypothetical protein QYE76_046460 [Lolium multiflorum]
MADGTPVTYEELPDELKKRYDEIKATLEADLIGSFREPFPWHQMEGILTARAIGYSKPYPDEYEMIPLPPKYRLPTSPNSVDQMAPAPSSTSADIWLN